MTTSRIPAPLVADQALPEPARRVLDALRRRRLEFDAGLHGVGSPSMTRRQLREGTGMTDRAARRAVEALRAAGHPVVSDSHVAGYWLSTDASEIRECLERTYMTRIRHHAAAARGLARAASTVASRPEQQGSLRGVLG